MPHTAVTLERKASMSPAPQEDGLATPNYSYEKRQRELAKKRKNEEKRQRKLAQKEGGPMPVEGADEPTSIDSATAPGADTTPPDGA